MKITIEAETKKEKEHFKKLELTDVTEFSVIGIQFMKGMIPKPFMHTHWGDTYQLQGKLFELIKRLDKYGDNLPAPK